MASAPNLRDTWKEENQRGLSLARAGQWLEADGVFARAAALLDDPPTAAQHSADERDEARAQLFSNRANACYHAGLLEDARRFAERSCALRVSLYGEESLSVARARSDLATILGASGHTDEARSLLDRAIRSVERKLGDRSAHLVPLLQNCARLLVSADRVAESEPYAERLRTLLNTLPASGVAPRSAPVDGEQILDGAAFDLVEPPPPTLNTLPAKQELKDRANPLGFEVEYGIPAEHHAPLPKLSPEAEADANVDADADADARAARAVGGIRSGRAQVVDSGRLQLLAVIVLAFAAGVAAVYWLSPGP